MLNFIVCSAMAFLLTLSICRAQLNKIPFVIPTEAVEASKIEMKFDPQTKLLAFKDELGPFTGVVFERYDDGKVNLWMVTKGRATHQTMYYADGQIERDLEMENGVEHGRFVMYYPDGKIYVDQYYDHGNPVKTWTRWNEDGVLVESINY